MGNQNKQTHKKRTKSQKQTKNSTNM